MLITLPITLHASPIYMFSYLLVRLLTSLLHGLLHSMLHTCFIAHANWLNRTHPSWLDIELPTKIPTKLDIKLSVELSTELSTKLSSWLSSWLPASYRTPYMLQIMRRSGAFEGFSLATSIPSVAVYSSFHIASSINFNALCIAKLLF